MGVADKTPWEKDIQVAEKAGQVTLWKPVCMKYTCCQTLGPVPSPTGPHGPTHFHKLRRVSTMTSQMMKKKMPHTRKDCLKDEYMTAAWLIMSESGLLPQNLSQNGLPFSPIFVCT